MPIGYNKVPFTLQEKIDKAFQVTYEVRNPQDADFLRNFLLELIEKAYTKVASTQIDRYKEQQND